MANYSVPTFLLPSVAVFVRKQTEDGRKLCSPLTLLLALIHYSQNQSKGTLLARDKNFVSEVDDFLKSRDPQSGIASMAMIFTGNPPQIDLDDKALKLMPSICRFYESFKGVSFSDVLFLSLIGSEDPEIDNLLKECSLNPRESVERWLSRNIRPQDDSSGDRVIDLGLEISSFLRRCAITEGIWGVIDKEDFSPLNVLGTIQQAASQCPADHSSMLPNNRLLDAILLGLTFYTVWTPNGNNPDLHRRQPTQEVTQALKTLLGITT